MTALISVYDSDGLVGRCDSRCYNAIRPTCRCVCGGMNHGQGLAAAAANTREAAEELRDHHCPPNAPPGRACYFGLEVEQGLPLLPTEP